MAYHSGDGSDARRGRSRRDVLATLGGALAGLTVAMSGPGRAQGGLRPVRLLHASNATLPLWSVTYLAEDMGFYREEGLAVTRLGLANGPTAMTALLAGNGDADASAPGEALGAVAQGQAVKILISYSNSNAYGLIASKAFAERYGLTLGSSLAEREVALRQARGARFGITTPGSLTDALTRLALRHVGLDPARDARILPLQGLTNGIAALANNGIDCFMGLSPFNEQAMVEIDAVPVLNIGAGEVLAGDRLQGQMLAARAQSIANDPDLYSAIVRADVRALRMIVQSPNEARDVLRRSRFAQLRAEIWPTAWRNNLRTFTSPYVTTGSIRAWIETGLVGGNPNPDAFPYEQAIDMRFVTAAAAGIGWNIPQPS